ncbi:MAG: DUF423 domain-containing protein [Planctomycetota bacterium]
MSGQGSSRFWWIALALLGASGVALGAFSAHGLEAHLLGRGMAEELVPKRVGQFDTGTRYHLIHAVALLALLSFQPTPRVPAFLLLLGTFFFSGSLYLLVLTDTPWLGAITPIGGLSWILAWLSLPFCIRSGTATPGEDAR